jgi:hypothetical protein
MAADDHAYTGIDIYSPAANAWRLPSRDPQDERMISERLRAMLSYLETYFEAGALRQSPQLEIASLPTPFIFAANGIAIYNLDNLPDKWVALFSDREEAEEAALQLMALFDHVDVPLAPNRFERNARIFTQLLRNLKPLPPEQSQPR